MTTEQTALTDPRQYQEALTSEKYQERLTLLLSGSDISPERFVGMVVQSLARSPRLLAPDVDRESLLLAVLTSAEMGLVPTGSYGGGWLVPFYDKASGKKKVQHITDWRGFLKMAFRSGQLRGAWAHPVYEGDHFTYDLGGKPALTHEPSLKPEERGSLTHFYAVAHLTTGERMFEVMTYAEIEAVRKRSRAAEEGPWITDYVEMGRKTVIRRLFKYLPVAVTSQLAQALEQEDAWEDQAEAVVSRVASPRRQRVLAHMAGTEPAALEGGEANGDTSTVEETTDGSAALGTAEEGS